MRIAVKEIVAKHLMKKRPRRCLNDFLYVNISSFQRFAVVDLDAFDELHSQHAL